MYKELNINNKLVTFIRIIAVIGIILIMSALYSYIQGGFNLNFVNFFGYSSAFGEGMSMHPVLQNGDFQITKKVKTEDIKIGDIITYYKYIEWEDESFYICHRVIDFSDDGGFITKGDHNEHIDEWVVYPNEITGRIEYVLKGSKIVKGETL